MHPAILLLGGSEGGDTMALLAGGFAARGYVAASVDYFKAPGLPNALENIPVETVGTALHAIELRNDVDAQRIGIFGGSRGGELALLAASIYSDIHAVIADVPSPFSWGGIPLTGSSATPPAWTVAGKALAFVPFRYVGNSRASFDASMKDLDAIARAFFHLEKINGPVLFLSAGDDRVWNSVAQARLGMNYLKRMHHAFGDVSLEYPEAGHTFLFAAPGRPMVSASPGPDGSVIEYGGSEEANIAASRDAFPKIGVFLVSALAPR
jgi:dienelactone hydrolase